MKTHRLFFAGILSVALLTPNACSKDDNGNVVASGTYRVCIEGTLYWSSRVLYQGTFALGGESAQVALTQQNSSDEQTNRDMFLNVTAEYVSNGTPSGIRSTARDNRQTPAVHDLQGRSVGKAVITPSP